MTNDELKDLWHELNSMSQRLKLRRAAKIGMKKKKNRKISTPEEAAIASLSILRIDPDDVDDDQWNLLVMLFGGECL